MVVVFGGWGCGVCIHCKSGNEQMCNFAKWPGIMTDGGFAEFVLVDSYTGLTRGRTISGLVAASVYIACREMNTPRTLKDIAAAANINRKHLAKTYRILLIALDVKVSLVDLIKCIAKVANKANLTEKTKRQAIRIMDEVTEKQISAGKNPMGIAATILYISCLKTGENKTQTDIARASGVTDVTIRNRFKELKSKLEVSDQKI
jgi:transcription initiation factor TFIIB